MRRLQVLTIAATVVAAALADTASADVRATLMLRSGEKVAGNLEALDSGNLFIRESKDEQKKFPLSQIALIDFVGAAAGLPETELREARGDQHLLLQRNGTAVKGRLLDIEGGRGTSEGVAAELTFVFRTENGQERRFKSEEIARLYLGNFPGTPTTTTGGTSTSTAAPGQSGTVQVVANQQWVDTGLVVMKGQGVRFSATGEVRLSANDNDVAVPAGSKLGRKAAGAPMPNALAGALIGRIGNGTPFGIGNQGGPLPMPATGRLYLGVNDDQVGDNSGAFSVTVTPEPQTTRSPATRRNP